MPLGISLPPVVQPYEDLVDHPPTESTYFAVLIDKEGKWLDHHRIGIDGIAMLRSKMQPNRVYLYLLSYERHALIGQFLIDLPPQLCN